MDFIARASFRSLPISSQSPLPKPTCPFLADRLEMVSIRNTSGDFLNCFLDMPNSATPRVFGFTPSHVYLVWTTRPILAFPTALPMSLVLDTVYSMMLGCQAHESTSAILTLLSVFFEKRKSP